MFYWSYKNIHVVLSDDEEMALVGELIKDPVERVGYHTSTLSKACTLTQRPLIADMSSGPITLRMPRGCFLSCLTHMDASLGEL